MPEVRQLECRFRLILFPRPTTAVGTRAFPMCSRRWRNNSVQTRSSPTSRSGIVGCDETALGESTLAQVERSEIQLGESPLTLTVVGDTFVDD